MMNVTNILKTVALEVAIQISTKKIRQRRVTDEFSLSICFYLPLMEYAGIKVKCQEK
jgi:hypothetical protein